MAGSVALCQHESKRGVTEAEAGADCLPTARTESEGGFQFGRTRPKASGNRVKKSS
jgi:hypothetical protein